MRKKKRVAPPAVDIGLITTWLGSRAHTIGALSERALADLCRERLRELGCDYWESWEPQPRRPKQAFAFVIGTDDDSWLDGVSAAGHGQSHEDACLASVTRALRLSRLSLDGCSAAERRCIEATVRAWEGEKP